LISVGFDKAADKAKAFRRAEARSKAKTPAHANDNRRQIMRKAATEEADE
jgi:hypothetical protein